MLLHAQLQGLGRRHEVSLVTSIGDEPWEAGAAEVARASAARVYIADRRRPDTLRRRTRRRVDLASRWTFSRVPWRNLWFGPPAVQEAIHRALSESTFDVVAVEDSAMARVRLPHGLPAVLTDHEVVRARPERSGHQCGARTALGDRLLASDWRRAQVFQAAMWDRYGRVQVFTQEEAQAVARLAPEVADRVRVNPFGIAVPPGVDPALEVEDSLLFLGNFTHLPNQDAAHWLAQEIMPLVWRERPAARLLLVGSDPPAEVRSLAGSQIEIRANVPDTGSYLESAAVCLAPVRFGGGMRVKVLTALACGKAVVTTSRGAQGFIFGRDEPPMVISDDAAGIAAGILRLLEDKQLRHSLGQRGRAVSQEHHSPEAWAARLERVYSELAAPEPSPAGVPEFAT
jgi:glycosyltransferase involved in cell wall biosynthesis